MTGEIFREALAFPTALSDDSTTRPRAETKVLLCSYTVLQSVFSLPCLC